MSFVKPAEVGYNSIFIRTRKSTRAKKEPSKYKDFEIGVGKSKRKEVEKNKQEVSGPAKKRRGRK